MATPTVTIGPGRLNIKIRQGATVSLPLTWSDANGPIDMTGYTARMQIRDAVDGSLLHELTTENGGLSISPNDGEVTVSIAAADTAAFSWTEGLYDIELIAPDTTVLSWVAGSFRVVPEQTR